MENNTSSSQGEEVESQGPKLEIKFIASDFSHYHKTHGKKKLSEILESFSLVANSLVVPILTTHNIFETGIINYP
ncbi:MAG: hypothetical protein CMB98_05615, partial [Flavobacteriaceae bacterium]|nr:hypothetical protein [Flavobacteriaceae bacterium]